MDEIKIEKGVPIPPRGRGANKTGLAHTLRTMETGDSFYYETKSKSSESAMATVTATAARVHGKKFTTRKEGNGCRVWRVE